MNRFRLPALLGLVVVSGCSAFGPSATDIVFETTATAYAPGDTVTVRLVNTTDGSIGYNLCYNTIEVKNDVWEPAAIADDGGGCLAVLLGLGAGEEAEYVTPLPDDVPAGAYRLTTDVEFDDGRRATVTAPFRVR